MSRCTVLDMQNELCMLYIKKLWLSNPSQQFINNCRHFSDRENIAVSSDIINYIPI